jgi:hypothetical protein
MYEFKHLRNAPQNLERVGYGPQLVGYGPQIVGQGAMQHQRSLSHGTRTSANNRGGVHRESPHGIPQDRPHRAIPGGGFLVEHPPTSKQVVFIGFGPQSINGGATFVFSAAPQRVFRGERLTVPSAIVNNFSINDLKVGADSMNIGAAAVPAALFSELGMLVALEIETASPGITILLSVTNITGNPQNFSAGLLGTSVS